MRQRLSIVTGSKQTLEIPASILRMKAQPVPEQYFGGDLLRTLVEEMWACMIEGFGVGIAAPQVGISWQIFVGHDDASGLPPTVFINPKITPIGEKVPGEEGCLSIPGYFSDKVPRAPEVRVEFRDMEGQTHDLNFEKRAARIIQHEYDHLDGKLFTDYVAADDDSDPVLRKVMKAMAPLKKPES